MGMPVTLWVIGSPKAPRAIQSAIAFLRQADQTFSTFKPDSEISRLNSGQLTPMQLSPQVKDVLVECEHLKRLSGGFFDARFSGRLDPSGYVKGWAIREAARILDSFGIERYLVEISGDLQVKGDGPTGEGWVIAISSPLATDQAATFIRLHHGAVATSGIYTQGLHIINPKTGEPVNDPLSLTVVGEDIALVDAYATAAYCMGSGGQGLAWLKLMGFDGLQINRQGQALATDGFRRLEALANSKPDAQPHHRPAAQG